MTSTLFILNDGPYDTERSYNALRLAQQLVKDEAAAVRIFLIGGAVLCAAKGQSTPDGFYKLDRMLHTCITHGAQVGVCGTCIDARALSEAHLIAGAQRSTMAELSDWTLWADRSLVF